ncbi:MAG: RagB/SusD family nutrient uptake outer membrane protein [Ferruginibacter sp.]
MKNKSIILLIQVMLFTAFSCKKTFLDITPDSVLTESTYFRNTAEVEGGVIACYDGLQATMQFEYKLTSLRDDDMTPYNLEGDWGALDGFYESSGNDFVRDFWARSYNVIARTNLVLKYIDNVTDATKKNTFQGEAKFIRGHMHFNLVRLYGDVPLITERIAYDANDNFKRISQADVYTQIISDLQDASTNLPATWAAASKGRLTKWAAKAMLAKVYLTRKNYAGAKTLIDEVIASGSYQLMPAYADVFSLSTELSNEVLYAVSYKAASNGEGQQFTYEYSRNGAVKGFKPQKEIINLIIATDLRKATSIGGTSSAPVSNKFIDATAPVRDAGNDLIIIRYSDVLLMKSEINANLNTTALGNPAAMTTQDSLDILAPWNQVRARAGLTAKKKNSYTGLTTFIEDLFTERRIEFCFENQRWYDLLRSKTPAEIVSIMNAHFLFNARTNTMQPYQTLMPIPQRDINLSNGILTQNPGY